MAVSIWTGCVSGTTGRIVQAGNKNDGVAANTPAPNLPAVEPDEGDLGLESFKTAGRNSALFNRKPAGLDGTGGGVVPLKNSGVGTWRSTSAVALVIGGLLLFNYFIRRRNLSLPGGRANRQITQLDRYSLDHKRSLVLFEAEGRRILVGVSPDRMQGIDAWYAAKDVEGESEVPDKSFEDLLDGAVRVEKGRAN